jgi:flagellar motility protein MotE (MotC chaperone)
MGAGRFFITEDCGTLDKALQDAVYDSKKQNDERLDDGSTDIDTLDAFEYTIERDIKSLLEV